MVERTKVREIIHAPAGSGKTTSIIHKIESLIDNNKMEKKILCITFTNRAADELNSKFNHPLVHVCTIHSFFLGFISAHLAEPVVIEEYFLHYNETLTRELCRLNNLKDERNSNICEEFISWEKKYGLMTINKLKLSFLKGKNEITYKKSRRSDFLFGRLSHKDFIEFSSHLLKHNERLQEKLYCTYTKIIIDEYQDTDPVVIDSIHVALKRSDTNFYLVGDPMQNIYNTDHSNIMEVLQDFEKKYLKNNYRSSKEIVTVLNRVYNDKNLIQKSMVLDEAGVKPLLYFGDEQVVKSIQDKYEGNEDQVLLVTTNSQVFQETPSFFKCYSSFKDYGYSNQRGNKMKDVINFQHSIDPIFQVLNESIKMIINYKDKKFSDVLLTYHHNKTIQSETGYVDKEQIISDLDFLSALFDQSQQGQRITVQKYMDTLYKRQLWKGAIKSFDFESMYNSADKCGLCDINIDEFIQAYQSTQLRSTQHGVKGEGYTNVIVFLKDSKIVKYSKFFKLWSNQQFNLKVLEQQYYNLKSNSFHLELVKLENKSPNIDKAWHSEFVESHLKNNIDNFWNSIKEEEEFYEYLVDFVAYTKYMQKPNVTNYKKLVIGNKLESTFEDVILAYKLFYVTLSRAKKRLIVVVDNKLKNERLKEKFKEVGFQVEEYEI